MNRILLGLDTKRLKTDEFRNTLSLLLDNYEAIELRYTCDSVFEILFSEKLKADAVDFGTDTMLFDKKILFDKRFMEMVSLFMKDGQLAVIGYHKGKMAVKPFYQDRPYLEGLTDFDLDDDGEDCIDGEYCAGYYD